MVGGDRNIAMAAKHAALKAFGARLQEARTATSLTQEDVADRLSVSSQTIRNWEAGRTEPSRVDKERIAALYNRPVEWFYGEEAPESEESRTLPAAIRNLVPDYDNLDEETAADLEMLLQESQLALRLGGKGELSPYTIRQIASFIRWVREQEDKPE